MLTSRGGFLSFRWEGGSENSTPAFDIGYQGEQITSVCWVCTLHMGYDMACTNAFAFNF